MGADLARGADRREAAAGRGLLAGRSPSRCSPGSGPSSASTGAASGCGCSRSPSAALAFGALGVAIGALAREVRAASLLAFLLSLPLAFLALVPAGAVAGGLYDVIRAISLVFPFKAALQALDAAVNRASPGLGGLARPPAGAHRPVRRARARRPAARVRSCAAAAAQAVMPSSPSVGLSSSAMAFPQTRMRRLRASPALRGLVRETELRAGPARAAAVRLRDPEPPAAASRATSSTAMPGVAAAVDLRSRRGGAARRRGWGSRRCCCSASPPRRTPRAPARGTTRASCSSCVQAIKRALPGAAGDHRRLPVRVHRATATAASLRDGRPPCRQRRLARAARAHRRQPRPRRRRHRRALGHDGRPRRRDPRRARRRGLLRDRRSWPTRPSSPRPSTGRSARPPARRRRSATAAATSWTRPTAARRCARRCSTCARAPTW